MIACERKIRVVDYDAAYGVAALMVNADDFHKDEQKSRRAGYTILVSESDPRYYICDLGDRLEVNLPDGKSVNIWIGDPRVKELEKELEEVSAGNQKLKEAVLDMSALKEHTEEQLSEVCEDYENQICKLKAKLYDLLVK